jgi:hypothetical protein
VSFHVNKATPDFEAGRSDNNAVSCEVPRPVGAKPNLIARQYIKQLVEAIRDVPATSPKDISTDRSVSSLFSRTTLVLLSCLYTEIYFLGVLPPSMSSLFLYFVIVFKKKRKNDFMSLLYT